MPQYTVSITVSGSNIASVRKQMAAAFPGEEVRCDKIEFNKSRADRLSDAEALVADALDCWRLAALENLQSELEEVSFGDVEFPSMF